MAKFLDDNGLAYLWSKIKATIPKSVNPNILDNWYFGNPVNQRNQTEYTSAAYTIDRWKKTSATGVFSVESDGCVLSNPSTATAAAQLTQYIDEAITGTVIFSVLVDGSLHSISADIATGATHGVPFGTLRIGKSSSTGKAFVQITVNAGVSTMLVAAKLELGDTQTIAHQDSSGAWVLNEIPNYGEQLARCQRYYVRYTAEHNGASWFSQGSAISATSVRFVINLPQSLRKGVNAAVENGNLRLLNISANTSAEFTALSAYNTTGNIVYIAATTSGFTTGNVAVLQAKATGAYLAFNCDL